MRLRSSRLTAIANAIRNLFYGASLDLRLAGADRLDPRITFSRTSNATLTGSNGLIRYAPHNLLTFSEQFDNAAWSKTRASISANTTAAPDGTTTADKIVEDTSASNTHQTFRSTSVSAGTPYTFSVYIKADGRNFAGVRYENGASTQFYQVNVNLTNGTATTASFGSPTGTSFSVTSAGNAWWRVSITVTAADSSFASVVYLQSVQGSNSYTGDGVSGAFLWGAQLEIGSTATTYNSTTVKNLLGYTQEFDNAAWTKSNAFVQTNLLTYSQEFDNAAWTKFNVSVNANTSVAPDGTATADKIIPVAANVPFKELQQNINITSGLTYTFAGYVKADGYRYAQIVGNSAVFGTFYVNFDLQTGTETAFDAGNSTVVARSITSVGNGWYRISASVTALSTASGRINVDVIPASNSVRGVSWASDGTSGILFWGAQLVQGSVAGDYQVTTAAAAAVQYAGPFGYLSAEKLVENTAAGNHYCVAIPATVGSVGCPITASVYIKAAERNSAALTIYSNGSSIARANFSTVTKTFSNTFGSAVWSFVDVGNGWFRVAGTAVSTSTTTNGLSVLLVDNTNSIVYTGDGTSGIYIFGAQLSDSASLDPYVYNPVAAPAAAAYYGPRFDYDASGATITENYGAELVSNGDFSNGNTGWTVGTGWSIGSGAATKTAGAQGYLEALSPSAFTSGVFYRVVLTVTRTAGTLYVYVRGALAATIGSGSGGNVTVYVAAGSSSVTGLRFDADASFAGSVDNISVKEYLGTTGTGTVPKGLLIEEQRTNLVTYSEQFDNAAWAKTGSSVTANANVAPDGTLTADRLVEDGATSTHRVSQAYTTSAIAYTFSVYAKASGRSIVQLFTNHTAAVSGCNFDLSSGTAGTPSAGITASITPVGNGFYRCSITYTALAAAGGVFVSPQTSISAAMNSSYAGDGFSGVFLWGAQLEAGSFATSYIPTVASQVTRAADIAVMQGANFSNWYNASEGTLFANFDINGQNAAANKVINFDAGSGYADSIDLYAPGTTPRFDVYVGGVTQAALTPAPGTAILNSFVSIAAGYKANDFGVSRNGGLVSTDTSGSLPSVTRVVIGSQSNNQYLNGHIKRIAYFPRRLSNSELQSITA